MSWPHVYLQGLPVAIVVHEDGDITYDVDLSDADLTEEPPAEYGNDVAARDQETLRRWLQRHQPD